MISIHALREEGDGLASSSALGLSNFNPRPPRGGRHRKWHCQCMAMQFQSTPSARRATPQRIRVPRTTSYFNPRPPRGGRLDIFLVVGLAEVISIHALREEGDRRGCGGLPLLCIFQSTPSARRATQAIMQGVYNHIISIHALREEGDASITAATVASWEFQSTPSARRATPEVALPMYGNAISIHALREEGDLTYSLSLVWPK